MGNLCGKRSKESESDPFSQPGRTVGSAPPAPQNPRAGVPKISSGGGGGAGQTLGGSRGGSAATDAREAAARAAEERAAKANPAKGKLGRDLASQKAKTRTDTLDDISRDERRRRDLDHTAETRNFD